MSAPVVCAGHEGRGCHEVATHAPDLSRTGTALCRDCWLEANWYRLPDEERAQGIAQLTDLVGSKTGGAP